jgi:hypothetical protein
MNPSLRLNSVPEIPFHSYHLVTKDLYFLSSNLTEPEVVLVF